METRVIIDATTGEELGTISLPEGTPERQWEAALSGYDNVKWKD